MKQRTNIELDERPVTTIMRRYRLKTKKDAVDLALRSLAGRRMTRDEALAMEGAHAIGELPPEVPPQGLS
ncbi:MAG: type II toxin-antitoxin system VapB family antitoxin [Myxococcales bacterium]|nr:type II toxin-antitoxin system VapB family antitoxin [Myxococcales bacterium]